MLSYAVIKFDIVVLNMCENGSLMQWFMTKLCVRINVDSDNNWNNK